MSKPGKRKQTKKFNEIPLDVEPVEGCSLTSTPLPPTNGIAHNPIPESLIVRSNQAKINVNTVSNLSKSQRITSTLAKQFAKILAELPDTALLNQTWTSDQVKKWEEFRRGDTAIGLCFRARFCGEDDPIADWKDSPDPIDRIGYVFSWQCVRFYETLWGVTQIAWTEMKKVFQELGEPLPFTKAWDFYIEMVSEEENAKFRKYLQSDYYHHNPTNPEKMFALMIKTIRAQTSELTIPDLSEQERHVLVKELGKIEFSQNLYVKLLETTIELTAQTNSVLQSEWRAHLAVRAEIVQDMGKVYSNARHHRIDWEVRSEQWIDGVCYARPDYKRRRS